MHFEIIDLYFNVIFVEIKLKNENLKRVFWEPEFGRPNRYTSLPNDLSTSLEEVCENIKILQSCHFDILGINHRCLRKMPIKKNNE